MPEGKVGYKMKRYELMAPCHFGLESVLKKEIIDLGYDVSKVEDGRVTFVGDAEAVCRANVNLRTAERVLIKVGSFHAETFEELFQGTKSLPWEDFVPKDGKFWVAKAASIKSKLFSPSDIQSIMKKAMVERMKSHYHTEWFEESGEKFPVRVFLMKDEVTVGLDTTGDSLHKRGYRRLTSKAPIAENLAAALIMLTPWRKDRILVDPFCGSGTFPIEAAMMAANIAPGMNREFLSMEWSHLISKQLWYDTFEEAREAVNMDVETDATTCMAGEVGLSGEIRPGGRIEQRIAEAAKLGFKQIIIPRSNMKGLDVSRFGIEVLPVGKVEEAFRIVFG